MNESPYLFTQPDITYRYEFTSVSTQKEIKKVVVLTLTELENVYNLALLDILPDGETTDMVESKNKDMTIVLATVIKIITDFLDKNPKVYVLIQGNDAKRQRLYQILINRDFESINKYFKVLGGNDSLIEPFQKNHSYEFFIVSKQTSL